MTTTIQSGNNYTDAQSLNKLKFSADENSPETLQFVAKQFEAIFLQMMLKSAHGDGDSDKDELFGNQQGDIYQDLHDKQLAINLASGKGVGIAEMLVKQLQMRGSGVDNSVPSSTAIDRQKINLNKSSEQSFSNQLSVANQPNVKESGLTEAESDKSIEAGTQFGTPQEFVQHLWPLAKAAAEKLGVSPEVILAQAALETGWGNKISKSASGESSYNLFNIKADSRWQGERVSVPTLEYRDGVAVRENAQFRSYGSYAESFADFAAFLENSPRYQPALAVAGDAQSFTRELSAAGYATDPKYAHKIMGIASGEPLQDALKAIKI